MNQKKFEQIANRLVPDTITVECVVQALQNMNEAKAVHDRERDSYIRGGGYSWGYHGHHYVRAMEEAAVEFQKILNEYIDARIMLKLEQMNPQF